MASPLVSRLGNGRKVDLAILAVYLLSLVVFAGYIRHQHSDTLRKVCLSVENLKAGQRDNAQATIDGDREFLRRNPDGTADFPRSVVVADIAAKQMIIDRYPPRSCDGATKGLQGPIGGGNR